jgi:hypothetical protein
VSDLTAFRDHCRMMADPNAWAGAHPWPKAMSISCYYAVEGHGHAADCAWGWQTCRCSCHDAERPTPPTDAERILWARLADEIDRWLAHGLDEAAREEHTAPLWEEAP